METFHVKLCGLTEADKSAFLSLLAMSTHMLSSPWQCVEDSKADLEVYCFDSEQGIEAWQRRSLGCFTALLSTQGNITEAFDIVLKKPLRASQLSAALNLIEEKITLPISAAIALQQSNFAKTNTKNAAVIRQSPIAQLTAKLHRLRYKPAAELPKLQFQLPPLSTQKLPSAYLNKTATRYWFQAIPSHPFQRVRLITDRLNQISQCSLPPIKGLLILSQYLDALEALLFERDNQSIAAEYHEVTAQQHAIEQLSLGFQALITCFMRIADHFYQRGEHPQQHPEYLYSLNQVCRTLVMCILQAFHHYRQPPRHTIKLLNQLYLYQEQAATLELHPESKTLKPIACFRSFYIQILLVGIADPYRLPRFGALRLFKKLGVYTAEVEISLLTEKQIGISNDFLLSGHFCVDTLSDELPKAMARTPLKIRSSANTRLINTQPVLQKLLKQSQQQSHLFNAIDLQLIKQITPHLNASYERQFHRLPVVKPRKVALFLGLSSIHHALHHPQQKTIEWWDMLNEAEHGVMLMRKQANSLQNPVDQLVLMREENNYKLASLVWFCLDHRHSAQMGLELIASSPVPSLCKPDGSTQFYISIVLSSTEQNILFTEKGVFSPERKLRLKTASDVLLIEAAQLINSTLDYEFFSYRTLQVL